MWLGKDGTVNTVVPELDECCVKLARYVESLDSAELTAIRRQTSALLSVVGSLTGGAERYTRDEESFRDMSLPSEVLENFVERWVLESWNLSLIRGVDARWRMDLLDLVDNILCDELERRGLEFFDVADY